ncbi:DUF1802 family protein [Calothrix sp. UHCC 0171]|uniref:DUF1802 family protein n=1 Tax=Calothrix sp. UHCC 0171 TaxID=3110245 RepID=UPI002B1FE040|nr:DUF1802 family protein [Calothrix sp. UHCC 0171]MEA5571385.1 DUF1802 family protein [Calothrix sp. UHCC 0171]
MDELTSTCHALKEWAIAIQALETGNTIMLLRKGGIHERGGVFQVAHEQVLLYPTYEHQQPFLLKPEYANRVCPVTSGWHPETIKISSFAQITDVLPISDEDVVNQLLPFHIWNDNFICDRLKWKASQPLFILLLRTYKLCHVEEIPYKEKYGGCKSWIDLERTINLQNSQPVLSDSEYSNMVINIRTVVGNKIYSSIT